MLQFEKATKTKARARIALIGPSGAGKTYSALAIAQGLGEKIAVIDTEHGSSQKYADQRFSFDVVTLKGDYNPNRYIEALRLAAASGYDVIIVDSLTHAWNAPGGVLEIVDNAAAKARGNTYAGWRVGTPAYQALVEEILQSPCHVIATMRAKQDYVVEQVNGKSVPKKIGLAPQMRDGIEYEFDIAGDIDLDHNLSISKSRASHLADRVVPKPGVELGKEIAAWLSEGAEPPAPTAADAEAANVIEAKRLQMALAEYAQDKGHETREDILNYYGADVADFKNIDWLRAKAAQYLDTNNTEETE